jgi:hypothetical protein
MAGRDDVYDADTLYPESGDPIRIKGIDSPEKAANQPGQWQSGELTRRIIKDGYLQGESQGEDVYGRTLADVYGAGGRSVSSAQVRTGLSDQSPVENGARQEQALLKHRASPMAYSLIPLIVAPRSKYSARALALSLRPVSNPVCPIQVLCEGLMSLL